MTRDLVEEAGLRESKQQREQQRADWDKIGQTRCLLRFTYTKFESEKERELGGLKSQYLEKYGEPYDPDKRP